MNAALIFIDFKINQLIVDFDRMVSSGTQSACLRKHEPLWTSGGNVHCY